MTKPSTEKSESIEKEKAAAKKPEDKSSPKPNRAASKLKSVLNKSSDGFKRSFTFVGKLKPAAVCAKQKLKAGYQAKPLYFLIGGAAFIGIVIGGGIYHVMHKHSSEAKPLANINYTHHIAAQMQRSSIDQSNQQRTAQLQRQLSLIQSELRNKNQSSTQITQLSNQVSSLSRAIEEVQQNALDAKQAALQSVNAANASARTREAQAAQVESQIAAIHKQLSPQNYLPSSALPFEVVGHGYWGNTLMVTIAMKDINGGFHYRLMGQGEQFLCQNLNWKVPGCTNWDLKKVSTQPLQAIFIDMSNPKKQVKAEL